jgi:uncharacterized protein YjiS (DUF1127 family)
MYSLNSFLSNSFASFKAHQADRQNRMHMFAMDDRQLADIGVTRGDLQFQTSKQRAKAISEAKEIKAKQKAEKKAIKELRAMSDAELHDLGITRGNIVEAVRYGRAGLEEQPMPVSAEHRSTRAEQKKAAYELEAMSDAQLEDIGIARADIATLVANGRPAETKARPSTDTRAPLHSGLVLVSANDSEAANSDLNDNAPKPPRTPVNRHVAA